MTLGKPSTTDYLNKGFSSDNCCSYAISLVAARKGLHVEWLGEPFFRHFQIPLTMANRLGNLYRISNAHRSIIFNKTRPLATPKSVLRQVKNKFTAAQCMASEGIVTTCPTRYSLDDKEQVKRLLKTAQFPLVLKPAKGSMGRGVYANIETRRELKQIVGAIKGEYIAEQHALGTEYRIYCFSGAPVAAVKRLPPSVKGDGQSSIAELIERDNQRRLAQHLPAIKLDEATELRLKKQGLKLATVAKQDQLVILSDKLGRSSGGLIERVEWSDIPACEELCLAIANAFPELDLFAADIIDTGSERVVLEVNTRPQISSLLFPDIGDPYDFAEAFVRYFFPEAKGEKAIEPLPNGKAIIRQLQSGVSRENFVDEALADEAPVIKEPHPELLHSQGNIHQLILQRAAWQQGCTVELFKNSKGYGRWLIKGSEHTLRFRQNMPSVTSLKTRQITNDKFATKQYLANAGIPTPAGDAFEATDWGAISKWYKQRGKGTRVVVKPIDGAGGRGVTSNIQTEAELSAAVTYAKSSQVVVEEHVEGQDYRLICSAGKFLAAIHRVPASVTGDGQSSIKQLIARRNKARQANPYLKKCVVVFDEAMEYRLAKQDLTINSVLADQQKLYLNDIANITAGGDSVDVTDLVHSDFKRLAEAAQLAFPDMAYCGVDVLVQDITRPANEQSVAVIEVNANCDVALHHFPSIGQPRDAAGVIISDLFAASEHNLAAKFFRVSGRVTGVGFRRWAARRSAALGLDACIYNEEQSVVIKARGSETALEQLQQDLIKGPKQAVPTAVNVRLLKANHLQPGIAIIER